MSLLRLCMWSGPRNISTAMTRAWESRGDTWIWDEPLYAHYLLSTGLDHPMKREIIEQGERDWRAVVERILGDVPAGKSIFFQKHMTHHLLPHIDRSWLNEVVNCFLIRDPREVVASYARKRESVSLTDTGIEQQAEIFDYVVELTGAIPPVIDARDVLSNPGGTLCALCRRIGVEFSSRMLSWPSGPRSTDGIWGEHWYDAVRNSTGFAAYRRRQVKLPQDLEELVEQSTAPYQRMYGHRIHGDSGADGAASLNEPAQRG